MAAQRQRQPGIPDQQPGDFADIAAVQIRPQRLEVEMAGTLREKK
jgi:hypothetical protein